MYGFWGVFKEEFVVDWKYLILPNTPKRKQSISSISLKSKAKQRPTRSWLVCKFINISNCVTRIYQTLWSCLTIFIRPPTVIVAVISTNFAELSVFRARIIRTYYATGNSALHRTCIKYCYFHHKMKKIFQDWTCEKEMTRKRRGTTTVCEFKNIWVDNIFLQNWEDIWKI